jgi:ech hydrogenase subunit A
MDEHEHHLHLKASKQHQFFAVFLLFLGAMNGLVFANSLPWLFFFWEITNLCSFLMIRHDGNAEACRNAQRALWIEPPGRRGVYDGQG